MKEASLFFLGVFLMVMATALALWGAQIIYKDRHPVTTTTTSIVQPTTSTTVGHVYSPYILECCRCPLTPVTVSRYTEGVDTAAEIAIKKEVQGEVRDERG